MSDISQWNIAAASNTSAPPNGAPEGMAPSTVNDTLREIMAAVARWYSDTDGTLVTGGSGNAYTLTTNNGHAALGDQSILAFRADRANTGAATLNVDGLGAKSMRVGGSALSSGAIVADTILIAVYNAEDTAYDVFGANAQSTGTFTGTMTGMSSSTTGTVNYTVSDGIATLYTTDDLVGTSNATGCTMTGLPSAVQPSGARRIPCSFSDGTPKLGLAVLASASGTIIFHAEDSGVFSASGFTASGSKGPPSGWTITYPL